MTSYFKYISAPTHGTRVTGIKPSNYSSKITQITEMVSIAQADYPQLAAADIHTVAYDGASSDRQTGIEWEVDAKLPVPEGYEEITRPLSACRK